MAAGADRRLSTTMRDPPHLRLTRRSEPTGEQILARARELIAFGWCQGTDARDAQRVPVPPWSTDATCWSLLGAIVAAADLPAEPGAATLGPLRRALTALAELIEEPLLAAWNDREGRTQDEVLRTLDAARLLCADRGDGDGDGDGG
jgi:hypothetical protein